jgi:2'-5' RNA ligase
VRLFVAAIPPERVLDQIEQWMGAGRSLAGEVDFRWTRRDQWHLTLAFLGDVDESLAPALDRRLAAVVKRHLTHPLTIEGLGRFDGRVLWAGVRGDRDALKDLARAVQGACRKAGVSVDERPFRPHVTLARARHPVDLRPVLQALPELRTTEWSADSIHLVRSHVGPHPTYETMGSWPLREPD